MGNPELSGSTAVRRFITNIIKGVLWFAGVIAAAVGLMFMGVTWELVFLLALVGVPLVVVAIAVYRRWS